MFSTHRVREKERGERGDTYALSRGLLRNRMKEGMRALYFEKQAKSFLRFNKLAIIKDNENY